MIGISSGVPGGPGSAEFYEDGTGIVDGIPASWSTCDDLELGMGLCPGVGHLNAMHISSLKATQHITIFLSVMMTMRKGGMMMNPTMDKM